MRMLRPRFAFDPTRLAALEDRAWFVLTSFQGRIGRREFWVGSAAIVLMLFAFEKATWRQAPHHAPLILIVAGALAVYPFAALATKRALDRGHGQNWGVAAVMLAVGTGLAAKALSAGPWALHASAAALVVWLATLVDLGLLPSVSSQEEPARPVGSALRR